MKCKVKPTNFAEERGITLIALIITIIVLVILAAVSISAVYNSKIINYATNGAVDYATESVKENEILDKTTSLMESAISNIESINAENGGTSGSTGEEPEPPIEEPEVGIDFGDMTEEEFINNYVGKYVDYTPESGTFSDHVGTMYSGDEDSKNVEVSTDTSVKWKILFADSNTLTLISDKSVHNRFYLQSYNGYNNGVLLLNNACKAMYSNSSLGATGRSLKIEDIESISNYSGATNIEYAPSYRYYPNIFMQEEGGNTSGSYGTLGRSEQSSYVTGSSSGSSSFQGRETWYSYTMSSSYMNQKYVDLFYCLQAAWLASRCVDYGDGWFNFNIFFMDNSYVNSYTLYRSTGDTDNNSCAIRPIVEIDLTKVNVGVTGTGADGDGYSLTLK